MEAKVCGLCEMFSSHLFSPLFISWGLILSLRSVPATEEFDNKLAFEFNGSTQPTQELTTEEEGILRTGTLLHH